MIFLQNLPGWDVLNNLSIFTLYIPMFVGTLLSLGSAIFGDEIAELFGSIFGDEDIGQGAADLLGGLFQSFGAGDPPNVEDLLEDNPQLREDIEALNRIREEFLGRTGELERRTEGLASEAESDFGDLRGRAIGLGDLINSNLEGVTGFDPSGIEGLEFLSQITDQFGDMDSSVFGDRETLSMLAQIIPQELSMRRGLEQDLGRLNQGRLGASSIQPGFDLSRMLIPAQQQFAEGVGGGLQAFLQQISQRDLMEQIEALLSGSQGRPQAQQGGGTFVPQFSLRSLIGSGGGSSSGSGFQGFQGIGG